MSRQRQINVQEPAVVSIKDGMEFGKEYIEFRFTCKAASGENKVAFYFHGGRMIFHNDKYFGSFRPFPWLKSKDGQYKTDIDGQKQTGQVWAKVAKKASSNFTAEELQLIAFGKSNPAALSLLPAHLQAAMNQDDIQYQDLDLQTWVSSFSQGMENVVFSFNVPSEFQASVAHLTNVVSSEKFSLVLRFDPSQPIYGKSELKEEFGIGELVKTFPLNLSYVGFIEGSTYEPAAKNSFINPEIVLTGLEKAKLAAKVKADSYLDLTFLKAQSQQMQDRLAKLGKGKKAHHAILTELNQAAEQKDSEAFDKAAALLTAFAEQEDTKLQVEKAQEYVQKAEKVLKSESAEPNEVEEKQQVANQAAKTAVDSEPESEVVADDVLASLFD